MSFGIGLGDIVTVINLAGKFYNTIRDGPEELDVVRSEVQSLQHCLRSLYDAITPPGSLLVNASGEQKQAIWEILRNCTKRLVKLEHPITWAQRSRNRNALNQLWARMRAYFTDHQGSRNALATHTASLNIFLSSLNHLALKNMQYQIIDAINHPMPASDRGGMIGSNAGGQGQDASFDAEWAALGQRLKRAGVRSSQLRRWQGDIHAFVMGFLRDSENAKNIRPDDTELGQLAQEIRDTLDKARVVNKQRKVRRRVEYKERMEMESYSRTHEEAVKNSDEDEDAEDIMEIFKSGLSFDVDEVRVMATFVEDVSQPERPPSPLEVPTTQYQTDTRSPRNKPQQDRRRY